MSDNHWRTHGSRRLYESEWFAFRLDDVELPNGRRIEYGIFEGREVAQVLAITPEGEVVLVRQWRQPVGGEFLSLPGGIVDDGEEPEEAARRELLEETGYVAGRVEKLCSVYSSPGRTDEIFHIFVAEVAGRRERSPDETEFIDVVEVGVGEARRMVSEGELFDSATVLALGWTQRL